MIQRQENGLEYLQFEILSAHPEVAHGVFTRAGGVSPPPFDRLNLARLEGDLPENVAANRKRAATALELEALASLHQVHGTTIALVNDLPPEECDRHHGDGLVADRPGLGLMVKQADCQAVVLYDPAHRAVANIHCGWRGNVKNILGRAVAAMSAAFGSNPADLLAGISPSLGPCCAQFVNFDREFGPAFGDYRVGRDRVDLWRLSQDQLAAAGVLPEHIETMGLCTACRTDWFFSFRAEKPLTGRFATIIGLRPGAEP